MSAMKNKNVLMALIFIAFMSTSAYCAQDSHSSQLRTEVSEYDQVNVTISGIAAKQIYDAMDSVPEVDGLTVDSETHKTRKGENVNCTMRPDLGDAGYFCQFHVDDNGHSAPGYQRS